MLQGIGSNSLSTESDAALVMRIRAGESSGFEAIMRRYNRRLFRIARGVLRNDADAEDVVQEAYLRAFTSLGQYQATGPFSAWLAKIAMNEALGRLRSRELARELLYLEGDGNGKEVDHMAQLRSHLPTPEQETARKEVRQLLETAIDALPDSYRMVFILFGVEEMSVAETASCLDIEPATVKTRYHRARKLLQQQLASLVDSAAGEVYSFDGVRCDRIVAGVLLKLAITHQRLSAEQVPET